FLLGNSEHGQGKKSRQRGGGMHERDPQRCGEPRLARPTPLLEPVLQVKGRPVRRPRTASQRGWVTVSPTAVARTLLVPIDLRIAMESPTTGPSAGCEGSMVSVI